MPSLEPFCHVGSGASLGSSSHHIHLSTISCPWCDAYTYLFGVRASIFSSFPLELKLHAEVEMRRGLPRAPLVVSGSGESPQTEHGASPARLDASSEVVARFSLHMQILAWTIF